MKYETEVLNCYNSGAKSGADISRELGIGRNRVWDVLKKHGISHVDFDLRNNPKIESDFQKDVLIGTVIGDGTVFRQNKTAEKCRFAMAHSIKQEQYFNKKYEILKPLIRSKPYYESETHKKTNKTYHCIKVQSRASILFTEIREKWYKDGKRIIHEEIMERGETCLAVKFFDDGCIVRSCGFETAMNNYDAESVDVLRTWMNDKFGVDTSIHCDGKVLYIPKRSKERFAEVVRPFATSDVLYKLGELLETPEAGNQQPSHANTSKSSVEGSTTNG